MDTASNGKIVLLKEYGNFAVISKKMLHYTMGYICPEKDTCEICNWKPTPPTRKQRLYALYRRTKWRMGKPFGLLGTKFGYWPPCDCDERDRW